VRIRRAYFEFRHGQLHVRTALPTTGGFDEQVTLFCLHPRARSSRVFDRFLPRMAADRSVYAPDLPGCGESDAAPQPGASAAASAMADLAGGLRLRQIDLLGFQDGSDVAVALALARPDLVRRLVLVSLTSTEGLAAAAQPSLVLRISDEWSETTRQGAMLLPNARLLDAAEYAPDLFDAAPRILAETFGPFLSRDAVPTPAAGHQPRPPRQP
jgi:pimeloyl-ACP methyl ester carboxylesterase